MKNISDAGWLVILALGIFFIGMAGTVLIQIFGK